MNINEFIKEYNSTKDKEKYISKCIKKTYIPYSEKIADCQRIINATIENNGMFKINTPVQFMLFTINIISKYTNIEYGENILDVFEKLDELNLIDTIISYIPEREFNSYKDILNMIKNDYMENNRNIVSFIETKIKAFGLSLDAMVEAIQKYISQNERQIEENK